MKWILVILSLIGVVFNIYKRPEGFIFWIVANVGWVYVNNKSGNKEQAVLFFIYFLLAVWGLWQWIR